MPISDKYMDYAKKVEAMLVDAGVRVELDDRAERLQAKIRDAQMEKVPYMLVVGEKEAEAGTVAVRKRDTREQEVISSEDFVMKIVEEDREKRL